MSCGVAVVVQGERLPALSVSWEQPSSALSSGFVVFFSECSLELDVSDWPPSSVVCLHCLLQDGDGQLGRGLDLARAHGQVDWDAERSDWFPAGEAS